MVDRNRLEIDPEIFLVKANDGACEEVVSAAGSVARSPVIFDTYRPLIALRHH